MISSTINDREFFKDMNNIIGYMNGFVEGAEIGKDKFLNSLAKNGIQIFKEFVDQQARVDPKMYHHIYEWYQTGAASGRLFDIDYSIENSGLTFNGTLSQSASIKSGSNVPFYDKARIMENGISVTIKPKTAKALKFNNGADDIFVSGQVTVENPGGIAVVGAFENIFELFFTQHFRQSVLELTGIKKYLESSRDFKDNFRYAKTQGKQKGINVGYNWITRAGDLSD